MNKNSKIIAGIILLAALAIGFFYFYNSGDLFQGRLSRDRGDSERRSTESANSEECKSLFENFDPNPEVIVKKMDGIEFKWNGPGCSDYEFSQYMLCFENLNNAIEYACVADVSGEFTSKYNYLKLTPAQWHFLDNEMKTTNSQGHVNMKWYVQSYFGDAFEGEVLETDGWEMTYLK